MRWIFLAILSLLLSSASMAHESDPLCVRNPADMPASWRPSPELRRSLDPAPWSQSEAKDAKRALTSAADEMIGYFERKPSAVKSLWDDSIEPLIQLTYASVNKPELDAKIGDAARRNLTLLITPYLSRDPERARCEEFESLLPLAIFAHRLYPAGDPRTDLVTKRTNAAFRACGSLTDATGFDLAKILADPVARRENVEDFFDVYIWSLWLIEAELYPEIALPAEARAFGPKAWKHFARLRLPAANAFKDGARDKEFNTIADLASHIVHIPTGTHRFPLYVADSPQLYRFHRESFYPVLQSGDLDLIASFVDSLRQYGCKPGTDVQVRDGTRYLLKAFHDSNGKWLSYRGEGERDADLGDYDRIHHPWTAALGLRDRRPQHPRAGTYGGIVRRWLPPPKK
jgi:hypothetical protein